jgi:2-polyprenyl-3-methyl-5-hydroxy-6-metoxy-1,4-benzoquinol methylase
MTSQFYHFQSPEAIIEYFNDYNLDYGAQKYLKFHALRYFILWGELILILESLDKNSEIHILDIGPGFFTEMLQEIIAKTLTNIKISGLGLRSDYLQTRSKLEFINFDLNQLYFESVNQSKKIPTKIPNINNLDIIICSEVLEHLYTGIDSSLKSFSRWLKPNGYLIIQTPNATSLHHRLKLFLGQNPYPLLRPNPSEPGHYREYTITELRTYLDEANFENLKLTTHNYFNYKGSWKNTLYKQICNFFPKSFKDGITLVINKKYNKQHNKKINNYAGF